MVAIFRQCLEGHDMWLDGFLAWSDCCARCWRQHSWQVYLNVFFISCFALWFRIRLRLMIFNHKMWEWSFAVVIVLITQDFRVQVFSFTAWVMLMIIRVISFIICIAALRAAAAGYSFLCGHGKIRQLIFCVPFINNGNLSRTMMPCRSIQPFLFQVSIFGSSINASYWGFRNRPPALLVQVWVLRP